MPPTKLRLPLQTAVFRACARKGAAGLESGLDQRILAARWGVKGGISHKKYINRGRRPREFLEILD